jgi:circadian clock protein KaiB
MTAIEPRSPSRSSMLRLYVAGSTPNSLRARQNLTAALSACDGAATALEVEIIDVFVEPRKAMKDQILVTPTLIASLAGDRTVIVGDLADSGALRNLLAGLTRAPPLAG